VVSLDRRAPTREELDEQHDRGDDQKKVDESATNARQKTKKPEHQNDCDQSPKHCSIPPPRLIVVDRFFRVAASPGDFATAVPEA